MENIETAILLMVVGIDMEYDIGSKIKAARLEKKLTQEQVAELLGVSRQPSAEISSAVQPSSKSMTASLSEALLIL